MIYSDLHWFVPIYFGFDSLEACLMDLESLKKQNCSIIISVIKDKGMWPDWYVEYIEVYCKQQKYFFPVYEWVHNGFTTAEGKAVLPRYDSYIIIT